MQGPGKPRVKRSLIDGEKMRFPRFDHTIPTHDCNPCTSTPTKLLQKSKKHKGTAFDISYYRPFKKYLLLLGQYPIQARWSRKLNVTVMLCSLISLLIPAFDTLFDLIKEEWETRKYEAHILNKVTKQGNMLARAYRTTLLSFMVVFLLLPLFPLFMDVILPLNETRPRQQMFRLKYFVNEDQYFFSIYLHSAWCSFVIVVIVVSIDSLYMLVVYHACSLFAMCGYQVVEATGGSNGDSNGISIKPFRKCIIMHYKALQFYQIIDESSRLSYFFQVLFNMIGITATAVQAVMYLHRPEEALRIAVFLIAQQFHLLIITLPGQMLMDQSLHLATDIYYSTWYQMPTNIQKVLYTMQIRSSRPCKLTAGGLYEMNIENFGITFKTCMSYFTMLLSLKD